MCHSPSGFYNQGLLYFSHKFDHEHALCIPGDEHVIDSIVHGDEYVINHRICSAQINM